MNVYRIEGFIVEAPDLTAAILVYLAHWRDVVWGGVPPQEIELHVELLANSPVLRLT